MSRLCWCIGDGGCLAVMSMPVMLKSVREIAMTIHVVDSVALTMHGRDRGTDVLM